MVVTGALEGVARLLVWLARGSFLRANAYSLGYVAASSGFLNNTPIVVIFMPILRSIAERFGRSASAVMMPLSFAAILGGMLTLIGTSTNLLVSGELAKLGERPLGFFDFTLPGLVLALAGGVYVLALPRFLPQRDDQPAVVAADGKQFIAELDVGPDSSLVGETAQAACSQPRRGHRAPRAARRAGDPAAVRESHPPPGDILIVAATRKVLTEMLAKYHGHLLHPPASERRSRRAASARWCSPRRWCGRPRGWSARRSS